MYPNCWQQPGKLYVPVIQKGRSSSKMR
jgi:hypothetical protein